MMYSVTDVAGLNRISRVVLGNAANAVAGMAANPVPPSAADLPAVGLTMFGVTTPLVTQLVEALAGRYDPLVFHATGTGGRSMEKLVESGLITAVLDMTTTEIADLVVGGVFPAGPDRLDVDRRDRRALRRLVRRPRHGQLRRPGRPCRSASPTASSTCTTRR